MKYIFAISFGLVWHSMMPENDAAITALIVLVSVDAFEWYMNRLAKKYDVKYN